MPLPSDYIDALNTLASAATRYRAETGGDMVLVGGGAVAIFTAGSFQSADFDLVAIMDDAFERAMLAEGFLHESRLDHLLIGYYHPTHPTYGFQQVSGDLFDGMADRKRMVKLAVKAPGHITLPSIEDMIADRLGQHATAGPTDDSRLRQARALFELAQTPDLEYLRRRIGDENGDPALLGL
ncbi:MAG: hypothetical protein ACRYG8_30690 [Janthinobacterium lividum]